MNRNQEIRANLIGDGFQKCPKRSNYVRMNVIGEIMQAINFESEDLYIEWEFFLPPHWQSDYEDLQENMPILSGSISEDMKRDWNVFSSITQSASPMQVTNKNGENELITNFCFPFDIQVQTKRSTFDELSKFPILFLTLSSLDSWGRKKLEGYSYCEIPRKGGYHEITVKAWAPAQSIYQKIHEFFLGGQNKLYDIKKIAQNSILNDENTQSAIDRHNLTTESKGSVKLVFNVAFQSKKYKDEQTAIYGAKKLNLVKQKQKLIDPSEIDRSNAGYAGQDGSYAPVIKNPYTTSLRYTTQSLNQ